MDSYVLKLSKDNKKVGEKRINSAETKSLFDELFYAYKNIRIANRD